MAAARQDGYRAEVQAAARSLWAVAAELRRLRAEGDALNYGQTLEDVEGQPTAAEILAVAYDTGDALQALLAAGNATNLARLL